MRYPFATEGVKHLYHAVLCEIIMLGLSVFVVLLGLAAINAESEGLLAIVAVLAIVLLVFAVAVLVLELVGTNKASNDEPLFKNAFYCLIGEIVLTVISAFVGNATASAIITLVNGALNILVTYFIAKGLISLFTNLGDQPMVEKAKKFLLIFFIVFAASVLIGFVEGFLGADSTVAQILDLIASVAAIIAEVLFLLLLKESYQKLSIAKKVAPEAEPTFDSEPDLVLEEVKEEKEEEQKEEPKDDLDL